MEKLTNNFEEKYYGFLFHYYRAEVSRETSWRNRLDVTTNWSVVVTAAILSFVFSNEGIHHTALIINYLVVLFFLYIESRRFRYYALLRERTKILEKHILGPLFSTKNSYVDTDKWLNELSASLITPKIDMSRLESLSWRLRRNYVFIISLLFIVWVFKVANYPKVAYTFPAFLENARTSFFPGWLIFSGMFLSVITIISLAFYIPKKYGHDDLP